MGLFQVFGFILRQDRPAKTFWRYGGRQKKRSDPARSDAALPNVTSLRSGTYGEWPDVAARVRGTPPIFLLTWLADLAFNVSRRSVADGPRAAPGQVHVLSCSRSTGSVGFGKSALVPPSERRVVGCALEARAVTSVSVL